VGVDKAQGVRQEREKKMVCEWDPEAQKKEQLKNSSIAA
jgi:hypothetical protein